jgi:hypothetical protein
MAHNKKKPIIELDKAGGKPLAYWPSAKDASAYYNIHQVNICYNVNGATKQAKGHYFRFATPKEIASYEIIQATIKPETAESAPLVENIPNPNIPVETIPESVQSADNQDDALSPFALLLQKSKNNFNKNSD